MRRRLAVRLAVLAAFATVSMGLACGEGALDNGTGPSSRSLTGTWVGQIENSTMRLTLNESPTGAVSGTGTFAEAGETFQLTVNGTVANGSFTLAITEPTHQPFSYSGTVQVNGTTATMNGVVNGSGFDNEQLTLTKQ